MNYSVVILSKDADNLVPCVRSIFEMEPALARERIIVVNDGARSEAESQLPGVRWVPGSKPFNFARNANHGILHAANVESIDVTKPNDEFRNFVPGAFMGDVILLNDDTRLLIPYGFTRLSQIVEANPQYGVVSAGITAAVGNPNQIAQNSEAIRDEPRMVCFIAAYIRREVLDKIGGLDERFSGAYNDDDMCLRARRAGFKIGVFDGCVVEHGVLPSTFRRPGAVAYDIHAEARIFQEKWGAGNWEL